MFSILAAIAPAAAYIANVSIPANVTYSTEVVTAYTTYCPEPTSFVEGTSTYIVTEPTTLTISDCPCTRTHTFSTSTVTVCSSSTGVAAPAVVATNGTASVHPVAAANMATSHKVSIAAAVGAVVAVAHLL